MSSTAKALGHLAIYSVDGVTWVSTSTVFSDPSPASVCRQSRLERVGGNWAPKRRFLTPRIP